MVLREQWHITTSLGESTRDGRPFTYSEVLCETAGKTRAARLGPPDCSCHHAAPDLCSCVSDGANRFVLLLREQLHITTSLGESTRDGRPFTYR